MDSILRHCTHTLLFSAVQVCMRVLQEPGVPPATIKARGLALKQLGTTREGKEGMGGK
jgi:hypothetical protein